MVKTSLVVLSVAGAGYLFSRCSQLHSVAFNVGNHGITFLMLCMVAVGVIAYKHTK